MPRATEHAKTGFIVGLIVGGLISFLRQSTESDLKGDKNIDWSEIIGWSLIGGLVSFFFSLLPDILEPAYTPNHRGFFHSFTVFGLLAIALFKIDQSTELDILRKSLFFCGIVGYGSHLVLDSKTPMGLDPI